LKIKENQLTKFFRRLGEFGDTQTSLGFSEDYYDDGELKKQLLKMAIKSDNGYIYFNELLYRSMRRKYGNMKISKKMQVFELKTQYQIYLMTLDIQKKTARSLSNQDIFNSIIKKENGVNPFLLVMNFKISFKTWLKFTRRLIQERQKNSKNGSEVSSLDEDQRQKMVAVEIEVEEFYSETTEEESQQDTSNLASLYKRRKPTQSLNVSGSQQEAMAPRHKSTSDHLRKFET
jgi:adenosine deaminase